MIVKRLSSAIAATALAFSVAQTASASDLKSVTERASYTMGYQIGQRFNAGGADIDVDAMAQAIKDALAGKESQLSSEDMDAAIKAFSDLQAAKQNTLGDENRKIGAAFLAENAKKDGVVTTASGLQYKVLTEGKGAKPSAQDKVEVHYRGTLIDGAEFDSSYRRGTPAVFPVGGVIKGWVEALQLMPQGSKWELYVPSDLAYGPRGAGPKIGPGATLIFEVELLNVGVE